MSIEVGDLVEVVRPSLCCGDDAERGMYFIVQELTNDSLFCSGCNSDLYTLYARVDNDGNWIEVSRLRKVPPRAELDRMENQEKRREPVYIPVDYLRLK